MRSLSRILLIIGVGAALAIAIEGSVSFSERLLSNEYQALEDPEILFIYPPIGIGLAIFVWKMLSSMFKSRKVPKDEEPDDQSS